MPACCGGAVLRDATRTPRDATNSSGRSRHPLELYQPAHVVAEVHHPDLEPCPCHADGAHDLAAHRVLLVTEHISTRARTLERVVFAASCVGDRGRLRAARRWMRLFTPPWLRAWPRSRPSGRRCRPTPGCRCCSHPESRRVSGS